MASDVTAEMKMLYVTRRLADLRALEQALAREDFNVFRTLGHQIKGNAQSFGYPELEAIAVAIEAAGDSRSVAELRSALKAFTGWCEMRRAGDG